MGKDETGTLRRLTELRQHVLEPLIAEHRGRIVKLMGDGLLIEFASVVDAVTCAVAWQNDVTKKEVSAENERLIFRIGINFGDVIVQGDDIHGDGVNIAARLEGLAEPGGICISGKVHEEIRNKLSIAFENMGEQQIKNIREPVQAYRWTELVANPTSEMVRTEKMPSLPDRPSIAVLPFTNMSGDVEQDYFADGMVEDILTGLARIKWLFVIARNSSFVYKGKSVDVKQAGRELGVRYILEGSVRKASNSVRVTGQLIEAATGVHVWADRYDRTLDDIFAIQDDLTMSVVAAVEPSLRQAEIERVKRKRPDNLDAYDLVLRAIPHVYMAMPDSAAKAVPLLESALEIEPDYALAHGFLAWSHEILFARGGFKEENRLGAIHHAHGAIAHGRDDATAMRRARLSTQRALALSSSCALAYNLGSVVMALAGDANRAIKWGEQALRLSPFDPINYAPWVSICFGNFQNGDYEAAAQAAQKIFQANPYWSTTHVLLAATHAKLGRLDAARTSAQRLLELQPDFSIGGFCSGFDIHAAAAAPLSEALNAAGLPD